MDGARAGAPGPLVCAPATSGRADDYTEEALRARGFSAPEAARLHALVRRHARGEFPELAGNLARVLFCCWLADQARLGDAIERDVRAETDGAAEPNADSADSEEALPYRSPVRGVLPSPSPDSALYPWGTW